MKLHTNTTESTSGLVFKKKVYLFDAKVELTDDEMRLFRSDPKLGKMTLATGLFHGGTEIEMGANTFVEGGGLKGAVFHSLDAQTEFETDLRQGCASLKDHLRRMEQVRGGPTTTEF
jgi:hypothetical protein